MSENVETIAKFLYCSSVLEENVAHAYRSLAERVEDPLVKSLVLYVSTDSLKHSIILRAIGESLTKNSEVAVEDCGNILGEIWRKLTMLAKEERLKKEKVEGAELISLADKMAEFESFAGEEHLIGLHLKVVSLMADKSRVDLGDLKNILEWIVEDEKRHEKIVTMIKNIVSKRER